MVELCNRAAAEAVEVESTQTACLSVQCIRLPHANMLQYISKNPIELLTTFDRNLRILFTI